MSDNPPIQAPPEIPRICTSCGKQIWIYDIERMSLKQGQRYLRTGQCADCQKHGDQNT